MPHLTRRAAAAIRFASLMLAALCANPSSAAPVTDAAEARLAGAWQKDLSPQLSQLPPERRQAAARAGLLGAVIVYQADHRVEMYPPCGEKREALNALGVQSASGTWALSDAGELTVSLNLFGKPVALRTSLQWQGEQLVMRDLNNGATETLGRYEGPLPLAC